MPNREGQTAGGFASGGPDWYADRAGGDAISAGEDKVTFYASLFPCRTDIYGIRWENGRDGRSA